MIGSSPFSLIRQIREIAGWKAQSPWTSGPTDFFIGQADVRFAGKTQFTASKGRVNGNCGRARSGIRIHTPFRACACEAHASTSSAIRARPRKRRNGRPSPPAPLVAWRRLNPAISSCVVQTARGTPFPRGSFSAIASVARHHVRQASGQRAFLGGTTPLKPLDPDLESRLFSLIR